MKNGTSSVSQNLSTLVKLQTLHTIWFHDKKKICTSHQAHHFSNVAYMITSACHRCKQTAWEGSDTEARPLARQLHDKLICTEPPFGTNPVANSCSCCLPQGSQSAKHKQIID
jgi:hypothetical protein